MPDSDPIITPGERPDDFAAVIVDIFSHIQFKLVGLVFLWFIFLSSDTFIGRVLSTFKDAVDYKCPTSYGTMLQGMFLVIALLVTDLLIRQKII